MTDYDRLFGLLAPFAQPETAEELVALLAAACDEAADPQSVLLALVQEGLVEELDVSLLPARGRTVRGQDPP